MKQHISGGESLIESLGKELLEKYKEINLLYNIGEKVSAGNTLSDIGRIFLNEIHKIVKFDYGSFYINLEEIANVETAGEETGSGKNDFKKIDKIFEDVHKNGNGIIENQMFSDDKKKIFSIIAAPIKTNQNNNIIGAIVLYSIKKDAYAASNLTFLSAISSYASNIIELARLYAYEKETVKYLELKNYELLTAKNSLLKENVNLKKNLKKNYVEENIFGISNPIKLLKDYIEKISSLSSSVLITGETGTGKELVAKAIHYSGNRADKPFIAINCSAVPESIFESELFGIEKGVATGVTQRRGKLLEANGGTIFLDEIADMPLTQQAKLLRAIEEKEVISVGSSDAVKLDVRFIAATNKDLSREASEGRFREDLFYRLNVLRIKVPSLKERREDIPLLIKRFVSAYAEKLNKHGLKISEEALNHLKKRAWKGNIRELKNTIEKLVAFAGGEEISDDLVLENTNEIDENSGNEIRPAFEINGLNLSGKKSLDINETEKELIKLALSACAGNKTSAAKKLGISREGLRLKFKKYGIKQ